MGGKYIDKSGVEGEQEQVMINVVDGFCVPYEINRNIRFQNRLFR